MIHENAIQLRINEQMSFKDAIMVFSSEVKNLDINDPQICVDLLLENLLTLSRSAETTLKAQHLLVELQFLKEIISKEMGAATKRGSKRDIERANELHDAWDHLYTFFTAIDVARNIAKNVETQKKKRKKN